MQNERVWRMLLLTLCVLVFMFALHAKTAVYNGGAPTKVTPSTASKLWLNGQKMEVQSVDLESGMLFWLAVPCSIAPYLNLESRVQGAFIPPAPRNIPLRYLHRFLRPPPVQA